VPARIVLQSRILEHSVQFFAKPQIYEKKKQLHLLMTWS